MKKVKTMETMETEEKTVKKAPTEWTILLKETYPLVKEALDTARRCLMALV